MLDDMVVVQWGSFASSDRLKSEQRFRNCVSPDERFARERKTKPLYYKILGKLRSAKRNKGDVGQRRVKLFRTSCKSSQKDFGAVGSL